MPQQLTRNLKFGFGLSLLFLVAISVASFVSIQNLFKSSDLVAHSNLVIQKLESGISIMKDAETGQRGYLLTGDTVFLEPYNGSYQRAVSTVNEFEQLTKDNPRQQQNAVKIKDILLTRLNALAQLIDKKRAGQAATTADLLPGKRSMDALRKAVDDAKKDENVLLNARLNRLERFTSITPVFLVLATLVAICISGFAYFRIVRGIAQRAKLYAELQIKERETANANEELAAVNEELNSANEELVSANEEIKASNEELAAFNEELNAANEEIASANEELNASNEDLATANEEINAANEQLVEAQEELYQSQQSLQELNDGLEESIEARTRELVASQGHFRVMMETMPQIAWTSSVDGEVTFYNKQWYDYTGLDYEQTKGWQWQSIIHPDDLAYNIEKYTSILKSGKQGEFEVREKRHDGNYRWHLVRLQPVTNEQGEIQLWVGTATDIHELKNLQQQKDDFISIASHELKTPVTSLKVSLQLLDRNKDTPTAPIVPKLIGQANKSLDRVSILIEDLLNVSKLNQGQLHLNKRQFNVNEVVNDCCQHVRMEGAHSIITEGDNQLEAYGDAERIEQVVVNFVNNAIKYAPNSKEIRVRIEKQDGMAKISVGDKGPGIPQDKVPHLFDRYYRVDSQGMQFSGLGLGLYISSEIIKRHGGRIGVDTEEGKGSTFWFTIPLKDNVNLN
ncbi:MAG: ATP-binding protein [Sphingobacteriales bacterium]